MNKASGDDGIPVELLHILKDDAVKVLHSNASKFGKVSSGHRTGKGQFSFQCRRMFKLPYNWLILQDSKVICKILQARFQQYGNFQMYKTDFKKAEEPEIKLPTPTGSWRKQGNSRKHLLLFTDYAKAFVWITTNRKILKRWEYQTTLPAS